MANHTELSLFAKREPSLREKPLSALDVCCGKGGVSDGFAQEGFTVLGIDIEDMPTKGYGHPFVRADLRELQGSMFQGYDVIWGSPPCRDFCELARLVGHLWKDPPNPKRGLELVNDFLFFVKLAKPKIWIMENSPNLEDYLMLKPRMTETLIGETMRRSFWGNFPLFLMPSDRRKRRLTERNSTGKGPSHMRINGKIPKDESWERAKIPLACSRAFAKACKDKLLEKC